MKKDTKEVDVEKRSPITRRAILYGSLVGILYIFLAVYVSLKTGLAFIGGMSILGYILLSVRGKYNPKENVVVSAIVDGTATISAGVVAGLPALVIFAYRNMFTLFNTPITLQLIFTITIFAGVLGVFLLLPFREQFMKMPWPHLVNLYKTIEGLGAEADVKNRLLKWMGVSAAYVGGVLSLGYVFPFDFTLIPPTQTLPNWWTKMMAFDKKALDFSVYPSVLTWNADPYTWNLNLYNNLSNIQSYYLFVGQTMSPYPLPSFMGISNNPLIASVGYFVGWKRAVMMLLGGVYSVLVWVFFENRYFPQPGRYADFGTHVGLPQIFYLAMGLLIAFIAWGFIKGAIDQLNNRRKMKALEKQIETQSEEQANQQIKLKKSKTPSTSMPVSSVPGQVKKPLKLTRPIIRDWIRLAFTQYKSVFVILAIFLVGSFLMFYVFQPFSNVQINPLFMTISAPAVLASSWWSAMVISETGMPTGFLTDLLAVPGILGFDINFSSLIVFFTLMTVMQTSALRVIGWFKVGRELKVKDRTVLLSVLYGALFAAVVGSAIIFLLYQTYGFGTSYFPAPTAAITGIFFLTILQLKTPILQTGAMFTTGGLSIIQYSQLFYQYITQPYLDPYFRYFPHIFFILGLIIGLALSKFDLSPVSFLVGVLIPPAYSFSIMFGGGVNYYVYRKNKNKPKEDYAKEDSKYQDRLSGVGAGAGLVYLIWIIITTLIMLLGF
nr:OPT/YSL family transporter [Candidatus Freyarchaeota archaeon]